MEKNFILFYQLVLRFSAILSVCASPRVGAWESSGPIWPTTHTYEGSEYFMTCCLPHTASPVNVECINLGGQRKPGTGTSMRELMIWKQETNIKQDSILNREMFSVLLMRMKTLLWFSLSWCIWTFLIYVVNEC